MHDYNLNFISNEDLYNHVKNTVKKYRSNISLKDFKKNIIDPIKLTFDSKIYNQEIKAAIEYEIARQIDKSNNNQIGYFHQNIFKYVGRGWSVPDKGYDIVNKERHYYIEMKNKHNTMNSSSSQKTYMRMQNTLLKNPNATCILVEVIAKRSQNTTWRISLDGTTASDKRIRRMSIDKFYELVTGEKTSFKSLCEQIPRVLEDVLNELGSNIVNNTVLKELEKISPNILKSLYLLSFKSYEGFDSLNV